MDKKDFLSSIVIILSFVITMLVVMLVLNAFSDNYDSVLEFYCKDTGGSWNFYECYSSPISDCEKIKTGIWCDYPDGTSKSEEEISLMFNSTI